MRGMWVEIVAAKELDVVQMSYASKIFGLGFGVAAEVDDVFWGVLSDAEH